MALSTTRSIAELQAEAERPSLRRALGPLNLTALGIGSIIGTGIFVLTGTAASQNAGPALVLSMIVAAVGLRVRGTLLRRVRVDDPGRGQRLHLRLRDLGELVAWIIGWDLILEYALSASTIAVGWSGYFVSLMHDLGVALPPALTAARGATARGHRRRRRAGRLQSAGERHRAAGDGAARHRHQAERRRQYRARAAQGMRARRLRGARRGVRAARASDTVRARRTPASSAISAGAA